MNGINTKIKNENLRKLIILCTYNIKGIIEKENIEELLPITDGKLYIYNENNKIVFMKNNKKIYEILSDANTYSSFEILNIITSNYGITCKGENILELMKYKNNIITFLI